MLSFISHFAPLRKPHSPHLLVCVPTAPCCLCNSPHLNPIPKAANHWSYIPSTVKYNLQMVSQWGVLFEISHKCPYSGYGKFCWLPIHTPCSPSSLLREPWFCSGVLREGRSTPVDEPCHPTYLCKDWSRVIGEVRDLSNKQQKQALATGVENSFIICQKPADFQANEA